MKSSKNFPRSHELLVIQITLVTRLSERLNIGTKLKKCKIWLTKKKNLSGKEMQTLKLAENFSLMLELPRNLFWNLWKVYVDCDYCLFEFFQCWIFDCWIFNWKKCNNKFNISVLRSFIKASFMFTVMNDAFCLW